MSVTSRQVMVHLWREDASFYGLSRRLAHRSHPRLWSHLFHAPLLTATLREELHDGFVEFQEKRETYEEVAANP
jgi:hypothetical protein